MTDEYEVGYGKPPKHTQFQKGCSGNPKGRPKGSESLLTMIQKTLDEKVLVSGPRRKRMTKMEVGLTQLANNVAKGDLKALKLALPLRERAQEKEVFLNPPVFQVNFVKSQWELDQEKSAQEEVEGKDQEGGTA